MRKLKLQMQITIFEHMRRTRVDRVVRESRGIGRQKGPSGWLGRRMRDLVLPLFLRMGAKRARQLYGYRLAWDQRVAA